MTKTTIKEVAKHAGVSQSTVSLVLNKSPRVTNGTRKKVQKSIRDLNYHPQRQARSLASQRTGNIGFILMERYKTANEPFYTRIFLGAEFEASTHDYYMLLTSVPENYNHQEDIPRFLLEENVDGVIVAGRNPHDLLQHLGKLQIPTVYIDYWLDGVTRNAILIDNPQGGYTAVKHLINQGRKHIAFCGGSSKHPSIQGRFNGYLRAMRESFGLSEDQIRSKGWVFLEPDETSPTLGYEACEKLLNAKTKPDAVFAVNDGTAIGCLRRIKKHNLSVPDDLMLIGFDDVEWGRHVDPPLSSVRVNKNQMGAMGVQMLVEMLQETNGSEMPHKRVLPTEVVARESTGGKSEDEAELYF